MIIEKKEFNVNGLQYTIRSARVEDAQKLSALRLKIDGETEYMDREKGEDFIDELDFEQRIKEDTEKKRNLFLVAEVQERLAGFSRCEGTDLKRSSHKAEFGVCVLKEFWGYGIGKHLLQQSLSWADTNGMKKISLNVLETNERAISLYKTYGFEAEGILKKEKLLSDGNYYNTVVMGRFHD
ncbi:GNAT family N-acetyltransferase [Bacillus vallismortis]|uniref:GNAT family N-acetyltransferase n=1 Tax=Bacillus vallismortis TaxID=72361 RepID=UPI0034600AB8